ncbi:hypothetical protein ACE4RR_19990 [Alteribacillus sp. HJP-4]
MVRINSCSDVAHPNSWMEDYYLWCVQEGQSGIRLKGCLTILIAKILERYSLKNYREDLVKLQPVIDFIHEHLYQIRSI